MVITLSDRASEGVYEDLSGPKMEGLLQEYFKEKNWENCIERQVIPDDANIFRNLLKTAIQEKKDLVFTTGGTGIGPRDITPEVVRSVMDFEIPGIMDAVRMKYGID